MPEGTPPRYSDDGKWWWDGQQWVPVSSPPPSRRPHVWLAIAGAVLILVVAGGLVYGVIAAAGIWRSGSHVSTPDAGHAFRNVRVCTANNFEQQGSVCNKDEAPRPFQTDMLMCSAEVKGEINQVVASGVYYEGHEIAHFANVLKDPTTSTYAGFGIAPGHPLPGGDWSCRFSTNGQSQSHPFRLNGPVESLLYGSSCDAKDVISQSFQQICKQDAAMITRPQAIACTAVLRGAENKNVEVVLTYSGGVAPPFTRSAKGVANTRLFPTSFVVHDTQVGGAIFQMPSGSYTCRWLIDGREVGQKDFQVSA